MEKERLEAWQTERANNIFERPLATIETLYAKIRIFSQFRGNLFHDLQVKKMVTVGFEQGIQNKTMHFFFRHLKKMVLNTQQWNNS